MDEGGGNFFRGFFFFGIVVAAFASWFSFTNSFSLSLSLSRFQVLLSCGVLKKSAVERKKKAREESDRAAAFP